MPFDVECCQLLSVQKTTNRNPAGSLLNFQSQSGDASMVRGLWLPICRLVLWVSRYPFSIESASVFIASIISSRLIQMSNLSFSFFVEIDDVSPVLHLSFCCMVSTHAKVFIFAVQAWQSVDYWRFFFPVGVEQRRPTQIMCSITQSAKSIYEERPIAITISIRKKRPLYLQYQYTVKMDLINTCNTQEIKFSTATRAENISKQIKCQIVSFPKKIKVIKIVWKLKNKLCIVSIINWEDVR